MTAQKIVFGSQFGDALSGEFLPHSDPAYNLHRLARLATSTVAKGTLLKDGWPIIGERLRLTKSATYAKAFEYKPSWSEANCMALTEGDYGQLCITGLRLTKQSESTLAVYDLSDGATNHLVYIHNDNQVELPLETGSEVDAAQAEIARVAQAFFNEA